MATRDTLRQRTEDNAATIQPVKFENLAVRIDNLFQSVANRAYEIFEGNGRTYGHDIEDWLQAEKELFHPVPVEITESGDGLEVRAEVSGFNEREIEVAVESCRLIITGKHEVDKEQQGQTVYQESCSNQILRVVDLPMAVDADNVSVILKNGVLQTKMPRAAQGKTIEIKPKAA